MNAFPVVTGCEPLGVDGDDLIFFTQKGVVDDARIRFGVSPEALPYGNINDPYYWKNYLGLGFQEAIDYVHDYELRGHPGLELKPGAWEFARQQSRFRKLHLVTARALDLVTITEDALVEHGLDQFFEAIHHTRNPYFDGSTQSKPEVCHRIGAKSHTDDSVAQAAECRRSGIQGIVVGDERWQHIQLAKPENEGIPHIPDLSHIGSVLPTPAEVTHG